MITFLSFLTLFLAIFPSPEVTSYARVSKYGQESRSLGSGTIFWRKQDNSSEEAVPEGRNLKDLRITVSPVYVAGKMANLKNGEAMDHPSTPKYSTLDQQMIAQLDDSRKEISARFNPPASFEHVVAHENSLRQKPAFSEIKPRPEFSDSFDYQPEFLGDKPISRPITIDTYPIANAGIKDSDSYGPNLDEAPEQPPIDFSKFSSGPSYISKPSPKPAFPEDTLDHPPYDDDHFPQDDIIYHHLPHHHDYEEHSTMEPEMNDQRLDKRPYSYYFIGKKLWYIPLYFSIYFIIYVAALVLKSVARHKINFPAHLAEAAGHAGHAGHARQIINQQDNSWWNLSSTILESIESFAQRFGKES